MPMARRTPLLVVVAFIPAVSWSIFSYFSFYYPSYFSGVSYFSGPLPGITIATLYSYVFLSPILLLLYFGSRSKYIVIVIIEFLSYLTTFVVYFFLWPLSGGGRTGIGTQIFPGSVESFFPLIPLLAILGAGYILSKFGGRRVTVTTVSTEKVLV